MLENFNKGNQNQIQITAVKKPSQTKMYQDFQRTFNNLYATLLKYNNF